MPSPLVDPLQLEALSTQWANLMIAASIKAIVVLALASLAALVLRRRAAATRHLIWTASVLALLSMPALTFIVPGLQIESLADWTLLPELDADPPSTPELSFEIRPAESAPSPVTLYSASTPALVSTLEPTTTLGTPPSASRWRVATLPVATPASENAALLSAVDPGPVPGSWATSLRSLARDAMRWTTKTWSLLIWELGVLIVFAWYALGNWRAQRLKRDCAKNGDPEWTGAVRAAADEIGLRRAPGLRWTRRSYTPLTLGLWRGTLILPERAQSWAPHQRREVLLHELSHVQRRDVFTQSLAQLACALFWFHPLPWIAASRMRLERERACDDRVLMAGSRASTYASHLLEMARSLRFESTLSSATVAMARRSQLGDRMESLLDGRPRGRTMGGWARGVVISAALVLTVPLAAMRPAGHGDPGGTTLRVDSGSFQSNDEHLQLRVTMRGTLRFAATEDAIEWMDEGAYFELEWHDLDDGTRRRVELDGKGDDGYDTHYVIGSRTHDFDEDARKWFAEALGIYLDRSGVVLDSRLDRWLEEGGPDAAIRHLEDLDGSWAVGLHATGLLERLEDSADRRHLVTAIIDRVDGGVPRSRLLHLVAHDFLSDADQALLWIGWVGDLDNEMAILQCMGELDDTVSLSTPALSLVLQTSDGLGSDFMKSQILTSLIPHVVADPRRTELFYRVADELESDFQYEQLVHRLRAARP